MTVGIAEELNDVAEDNHDVGVRYLQEKMHAISESKGWHEGADRTFGDYVALIHSEVSEALEEYRNGHAVTETYFGEGGKPEGVPVELADVVIRIMDCCEQLGIDLLSAIKLKAEYNETRPHRHGNKVL